MSATTKDNALREQGAGETTANSGTSLTELTATVKARLLEGHLLRLIDFKPEQREEVMGIVANLRDKIAISVAWRTVRESSLSETRLRAKTYRIAGAFLREVSHG